MTALSVVIYCIIAVIILTLFLTISIKFEYDMEKPFKLRLFLYNEKIGINLLGKKRKKKPEEDKKTETEEKEETKNKKSVFEKLYDIYTEFSKVKYTYYYSQDFIRKRIMVKQLNVNVLFGMSDAAKTGIATGTIWALLYNMFALLTKVVTVKNHNFNVEPDYNREKFLFSANGIINFRLVNIISIFVFVLIKYIKVSKNTTLKEVI